MFDQELDRYRAAARFIVAHAAAGDACCLTRFFPHLAGLVVDEVTDQGEHVLVTARVPSGQAAPCRVCGTASSRVHGRYQRLLHDLPAAGRPVVIALTVRRLICQNPDCRVRTFAEPVPDLARRFARRTTLLGRFLELMALALAGRAASRLLKLLGVRVGRDTLIGLVRALPDPEVGQVTVLGVDDFAKRRGQSYATLVVDMDTHRPIDVLDDREASSLAEWLRAHPGVEVVCRDRAGAYANGAREGAPEAIQCADRWHLWANLGDYVQKTVAAHHRCVKQHYADLKAVALEQAPAPAQAAEQATFVQGESRARVARTRRLYEQVQALKAEGKHIAAITRELRISPVTTRRYFHAATVDELVVALQTGWPSKLDDYKPYLHERWNADCTNVTQLFREIQAMGYRGCSRSVHRYMHQFAPAAAPPAVPPPPKVRHITSWIRRRPDNLDDDERVQLKEVLAACPHLEALHGHVKAFAEMMTGRHGGRLDHWIAATHAADLPHLHTFAAGLKRDYDAVRNGLTLPYSSGAVEGNVCRVKAIKRSRYGRAKLDLLRKIILCADRTDPHRL